MPYPLWAQLAPIEVKTDFYGIGYDPAQADPTLTSSVTARKDPASSTLLGRPSWRMHAREAKEPFMGR